MRVSALSEAINWRLPACESHYWDRLCGELLICVENQQFATHRAVVTRECGLVLQPDFERV